MRLLRPACLFLVSVLVVGVPAYAAEPDPMLAQDEKLLRDARIATDGPGLLAFFRERTPTDADRANLANLVRNLGDDSYEVREKATAELPKRGRLAVPFLKAAIKDPDPEVSRRATYALREIEEGRELILSAAAARLLAARRPEGTVEVLLAYLPAAGDDFVEETVVAALDALGRRDGKALPALVAALKDKEAVRRAAAAVVVGKGTPEQRKEVAALLADADAKVRFHAASALARAGDRSAVPVLIELLTEGPLSMSWQVEDILYRIGGSREMPPSLGTADDGSRRASRKAWESWWKEHGDKIDLSKLSLEEPELGHTLVCDLNGGRTGLGRVWLCARDGKVLWQFDNVQGPIDAHILPGGRVLVAEHNGNRVTERDRNGDIVWETKTQHNPVSCQRLPNGNTFIATYNELREVSREGRIIFSKSMNYGVYYALKLRNGNILFAHSQNKLVEMDGTGKELRSIPCSGTGSWAGVEPLPNGNFLVALYGVNKVVEIDSQGRQFWEASVKSPTYAVRLRNGNTLVSSPDSYRVVELDRVGKEVWSQATERHNRPFRVRRY